MFNIQVVVDNIFVCYMRKFESSQKDESRAQSADSSKAYRKRRAFYWSILLMLLTHVICALSLRWTEYQYSVAAQLLQLVVVLQFSFFNWASKTGFLNLGSMNALGVHECVLGVPWTEIQSRKFAGLKPTFVTLFSLITPQQSVQLWAN